MEDIQMTLRYPTNRQSFERLAKEASLQGEFRTFNKVEYNRHFYVRGSFSKHETPIPEDAVFYAELLDKDGKAVRHCSTSRKKDQNLFVDYPGLFYSDSYRKKDPDFRILKDYGFAELLVKDLKDPYASLRDASIKCYYDDDKFSLFFCSGTDKEHGSYLNDSIGFVDENGNPFEALPIGTYTIHLTLSEKDGKLISELFQEISIVKNDSVLLARFDPMDHFYTMFQFAIDHDVFFIMDILVGFIVPYFGSYVDGEYSGHLGIRSLYAAQDLVKYNTDKVYIFNYLMDPTSMSYSLEIPYLQHRGYFQHKNKLHIFCYEYGEPVLQGKRMPLRECKKGELMHLYRVDLVNDKAKENFFNLNEEALEAVILDRDNIEIPCGSTFAVTGVVNPYPRAAEEFVQQESNFFTFTDDYGKIVYTISYDGKTETEERNLLMVRYKDFPIGDSAYEFYNLFKAKPEMKGKEVTLKLQAYDPKGMAVEGAKQTVKIKVK